MQVLRYLYSRGMDPLSADSIEHTLKLQETHSADAIVFDGATQSVSDIESFHSAWKDADDEAVICYLLTASQAEQLNPALCCDGSFVLEFPACYVTSGSASHICLTTLQDR